ncbi:acid phosphatase [Citrobacter braakii]|uniref:acid phosphatase n=1 Tax=Citrobacter braakii TaxID=57706 RepID=UPI003C2E2636
MFLTSINIKALRPVTLCNFISIYEKIIKEVSFIMLLICTSSAFLPLIAYSKDTKPDAIKTIQHREYEDNNIVYLPGPPEFDSISFLLDRMLYDRGRLNLKNIEGVKAFNDTTIIGEPGGIALAFSEAFGYPININQTPEIYKIIDNLIREETKKVIDPLKEKYKRVRPFFFFSQDSCNVSEESKLSVDGSYPSSTSAMAWATALFLSEINPNNSHDILKRGYELGQSRVICGYHWQSDVDSGRLVGSVIISNLQASEKYRQQIAKAKGEFYLLDNNKK